MFLYVKGTVAERSRYSGFHLLLCYTNGSQSQVWARTKLNSRNISLVSQMPIRGSCTAAILCSLPRCISNKLDRKQSSLDRKGPSHKGYWQYKHGVDVLCNTGAGDFSLDHRRACEVPSHQQLLFSFSFFYKSSDTGVRELLVNKA